MLVANTIVTTLDNRAPMDAIEPIMMDLSLGIP